MAPSHALALVRAQAKCWQGYMQAGLLSREIGLIPGCRRCPKSGRQRCRQRYRELPADPARSKNPSMRGASMRENREVPCSPARLNTGGPLREGQGGTPEMNEHGKSDSPVAPAKPPNKAAGCGGGGGKGAGRGEHGQPGTSRTQCRTRRAKRAGPCATSSTKGQGRKVHSAAAPCRPRPLASCLRGDQPEGGDRSGRGDVGSLRTGTRGQPRGPTPKGPQRALPGNTDSQGVHSEGGRADATARHRRPGGQDPPTGGRRTPLSSPDPAPSP